MGGSATGSSSKIKTGEGHGQPESFRAQELLDETKDTIGERIAAEEAKRVASLAQVADTAATTKAGIGMSADVMKREADTAAKLAEEARLAQIAAKAEQTKGFNPVRPLNENEKAKLPIGVDPDTLWAHIARAIGTEVTLSPQAMLTKAGKVLPLGAPGAVLGAMQAVKAAPMNFFGGNTNWQENLRKNLMMPYKQGKVVGSQTPVWIGSAKGRSGATEEYNAEQRRVQAAELVRKILENQ